MSQRTDSKAGFPQPGLDAAREGRSFLLYVNEKTGLNSEAVLTDATMLKVVENGKRLVIRSLYAALNTDSDTMQFDLVKTAEEDGSGQITVITGHFHLLTNPATGVDAAVSHTFDPPLVVSRVPGTSRAISVQALGNDADAALTVQLHGWEEEDLDSN